jgi:hypothetical protein
MLLRSTAACLLLCFGLLLASAQRHEVECPNELEQTHGGAPNHDEVPPVRAVALSFPEGSRHAPLADEQDAPPPPDPSRPLHVPRAAARFLDLS